MIFPIFCYICSKHSLLVCHSHFTLPFFFYTDIYIFYAILIFLSFVISSTDFIFRNYIILKLDKKLSLLFNVTFVVLFLYVFFIL